MTASTDLEFKRRFEFALGLRFELFYALQVIADAESRIHARWRRRVLDELPRAFRKSCEELGGSPQIWPMVADALGTKPPDLSFAEIHSELERLGLDEFQMRILRGIIHDQRLAERLIRRKLTLKQAFAYLPKPKQEWLTHIGLYPYRPEEPIVTALGLLIDRPGDFRGAVLQAVELFWRIAFQFDWQRIQGQLMRSIEERERLFETCSFAEFSRQALLRIEVDEESQVMRASRGGYTLPFGDLGHGYLMPSAFNDKRYWTAFVQRGKTCVYFPYFDPSITLDLESVRRNFEHADPQLDPALIFKALADPTRFAMAKIIAARPTSSVELARMLDISKPTISHHVHALRDAGLVAETYRNGAVWLSLKRVVIEALSALAVRELFANERHSPNVLEKRSRP